jgi:hypothetical protein
MRNIVLFLLMVEVVLFQAAIAIEDQDCYQIVPIECPQFSVMYCTDESDCQWDPLLQYHKCPKEKESRSTNNTYHNFDNAVPNGYAYLGS